MIFRSSRKRARRRIWPIHAYVGANGGGKSAAMVWDSLPTLEAGRPVMSTVRLLDYQNPRPCSGFRYDAIAGEEQLCELCSDLTYGDDPEAIGERRGHLQAHPLWVPFTDWEQLLTASRCDLLLDEVTGVASSRESQSMPAPVANKLVQLRRDDVVVRWSAPSWARADKIIRECSQAVTYCQGYMPKETVDVEGDRLWRNRRMFEWKTFDAAEFEDFTVGKREQLRPTVVDWHWGPGSPTFAAYDTFDAVLSIGMVSDAGRCYTCGGRRSPHDCYCPDYVHRKVSAKAASAEAARARPEAEHDADTNGTRGHTPADVSARTLTGRLPDW